MHIVEECEKSTKELVKLRVVSMWAPPKKPPESRVVVARVALPSNDKKKR